MIVINTITKKAEKANESKKAPPFLSEHAKDMIKSFEKVGYKNIPDIRLDELIEELKSRNYNDANQLVIYLLCHGNQYHEVLDEVG